MDGLWILIAYFKALAAPQNRPLNEMLRPKINKHLETLWSKICLKTGAQHFSPCLEKPSRHFSRSITGYNQFHQTLQTFLQAFNCYNQFHQDLQTFLQVYNWLYITSFTKLSRSTFSLWGQGGMRKMRDISRKSSWSCGSWGQGWGWGRFQENHLQHVVPRVREGGRRFQDPENQ